MAYITRKEKPPKISREKQYYLAPELIWGNEYQEEFKDYADVFSLGLLFYELLFRKPLYESQVSDRLINKEVDFNAKEFKVLSGKCVELFKQMIELDPNYRVSPIDALDHNYFTQTDNYNPGENYLFKSFQSTLSMNSFDMLVDIAYNKRIEEENNQIRDRYYVTLMPKKPSDLTKNVQFHLNTTTLGKTKSLRSVKSIKSIKNFITYSA